MSTPTLLLTYSAKESEAPGIFIGRVCEIPGIFAQSASLDGVRSDLLRNAYIMQQVKPQAFALLLGRQLAGGPLGQCHIELSSAPAPPL